MIIARYNNVVCEIEESVKLSRRSNRIKFLEFFEGSDDAFIIKWKKKYPQHKFQIFRNIRKPLLNWARTLIEGSLEVKSKLRDYNLSKLDID